MTKLRLPIDGVFYFMEIWKDVVGYESLYQVSNLGRVKSLYQKKEKILKKCFTIDFYHRVNLCNKGKNKNFRVHRLVAEAFIPNINQKETVNHIDGNKQNNNVNNLEWATRKEQTEHALRTGLFKPPICIKVIDTTTKKIYNNAKEVSLLFNINLSTLRAKLIGTRKNNTNYEYFRK